ncbi:MAG: polysulfide reductase NrfD [Chloroflexi bacterium]|nr:polysulfide reductase NrfD [Chloroflexota bacterium]
MNGFIYPNEAETAWGLLIVLYPYITGLVAGAFVVSSLYHAFGIEKLRPLARFSLLTALAFVLIAPVPLLAHLGRPERAFEIFITPNFRSAMAGFGYILLFYTGLLVVETWLAFRRDIVRRSEAATGLRRAFYSALTLGSRDVSERALRLDAKVIRVLAIVGIPSAFLLHGYVGFLFGSIKANPWWSTPLMPIIFLISAIVSGVALLIVLYIVATALRRQPLNHSSVAELAKWLLLFLLVDLTLEGLEVLSMAYENEEGWAIVSQLLTQKLAVSFFGIQILLGAILPIVVLGGLALTDRLGQRVRTTLSLGTALLVLVGIFAMRWNVVIGGQLFSKSLRGFKSFAPPLTGNESVVEALIILSLPFFLLALFAVLLPPWEKEAALEGAGVPEPTVTIPIPSRLVGPRAR